ncbi:neuropeptide CCHamide-2 [Toxorhynchites rutilus septentrionalis]|uniref:neuropeptide CCHamide-2 n=1 Tax=Toxorhynchites rutilus septentrionalis TaxID=329112 RepID=UPI00247894F3|nr:neuropeptide CCHamide-2 [Toxorhynchites rutilus septentrionalis]XP_055615870.1 neuropeptide CCHamide-2 [Toxorhynchites rutilus septentrionalis]XP_055615871.1 neuropeptide CCHamide-2 [Toxorhynchites rutilus septentrionalis]
MSQLSAICISLVIASVLIHNASGKRGCAAYGHACYGGHGKRSPPMTQGMLFDDGSGQLESLPPLPYAKLALIDRSKSLDVAPELGPITTSEEMLAARDQSAYEQEKFERRVRFAVNAILRQLIGTENENQPAFPKQRPEASYQNSESTRQLLGNEDK